MATLEGHGGTVGDGGRNFVASFSQDVCDFSLHDFRSTKSETSLPHESRHIEIPMTVPFKSQFCHSSFSSDMFANDVERLNCEGIGPEGNFGIMSMGVLSVGQGSEEVGRGLTALDFPLNFADVTTNAKTSIEAGLPKTQTTTTSDDNKTKTDDDNDEQNDHTSVRFCDQSLTPTTTTLETTET
jgi:hypothetical protein